MKRFFVAIMIVVVMATLMACTANVTPSPSPSPAASPTLAPAPSPDPSPLASPSVNTLDAAAFRPVVIGAKLLFNTTEVNATPYYGANNVILLPLQPLAEAMGWRVEKSTAGTSEALLLTKAGLNDLTIQYIPPSVGQNQVSGVMANQGATSVNIDPMLYYADGTIYVPESFIDTAMERIDVTYDGTSTVTVKPGA